MFRNTPKIENSTKNGYASMISAGFDTLVETFNMVIPDELVFRLENAKKVAQQSDKRGNGVSCLDFGGEIMQISPHGGRGTIWILHCPDFDIDIRSPETDWHISIRYSAAGLWQYGVDELRARVNKMLMAECFPKSKNGEIWSQVSSAHIAFDFYSPKFTEEMRPDIISRFVCHSSSKKHLNFSIKGNAWGRADYLETVTVGSKKTIELQIYDKGKEITEQSGKTWMNNVWEQNGYYPPEKEKNKHIWRLEIRFGKDFLKNRDIKTFDDFYISYEKLIAEALFSKRLTAKSSDKNIRRRPLHELFSIAHEKSGAVKKMLPIGKTCTMSGEARFNMYVQQSAGLMRNMAVIKIGDADNEDMQVMAQRVYQHAMQDPDHELKVSKKIEKYKFVNMSE